MIYSNGSGRPMSPPPGLIFHAGMGDGEEFFTVIVWDPERRMTHSHRYLRGQ